MRISRQKIESLILSEISLKHEIDSDEYINELDDLILSIKNLKSSLRKGPSRKSNRKEMHRLQSAIEAVRFIKKKSKRKREKMLSEGGRKISHLPEDKIAKLSPEVVTSAISIYRDLIAQFNDYLGQKGLDPVSPDRAVGSTAYYQEDLEEDSDVIYGDIDYLVVFPHVKNSENFKNLRDLQSRTKREYSGYFLDFIKSSSPDNVDVELTGEVSPTMVVLSLPDDKKVQVDLIATFPRYQEWMNTRWVPERGVKGYIGGNLYKAFGDSLVLTVGDQGVIARTIDGKRVSSNKRGKEVNVEQISSSPQTFFKDIVSYLSGDSLQISKDLEDFQGMDPKNISVSDIAKGIRLVSENLYENDSLPSRFKNPREMLEEVLARFKIAIDNSLSKKSKPSSQGGMLSDEKLSKLVKMNAEQYNNVKSEFNL